MARLGIAESGISGVGGIDPPGGGGGGDVATNVIYVNRHRPDTRILYQLGVLAGQTWTSSDASALAWRLEGRVNELAPWATVTSSTILSGSAGVMGAAVPYPAMRFVFTFTEEITYDTLYVWIDVTP